MIGPLSCWAAYGEKPDCAGLLSFAGMPWTEDPADLEGADAAIVGAPTDDLVPDRPGARFGPRAMIRAARCPPGPHLETGVDAFAELRVVDFGDAPVLQADPVRSHEAIEATVGRVAMRRGGPGLTRRGGSVSSRDTDPPRPGLGGPDRPDRPASPGGDDSARMPGRKSVVIHSTSSSGGTSRFFRHQ